MRLGAAEKQFIGFMSQFKEVVETYEFVDVDGAKIMMDALGYPVFTGKAFYKSSSDINDRFGSGVKLIKTESGYKVTLRTLVRR